MVSARNMKTTGKRTEESCSHSCTSVIYVVVVVHEVPAVIISHI